MDEFGLFIEPNDEHIAKRREKSNRRKSLKVKINSPNSPIEEGKALERKFSTIHLENKLNVGALRMIHKVGLLCRVGFALIYF